MDKNVWATVTNTFVDGLGKLTFVSDKDGVVPSRIIQGKFVSFFDKEFASLKYREPFSVYVKGGPIGIAANHGDKQSEVLRITVEAGIHYNIEIGVNKPFMIVGGFVLGFVDLLDPRNLLNETGIKLSDDYERNKRVVKIKEGVREKFVPDSADFAKLSG